MQDYNKILEKITDRMETLNVSPYKLSKMAGISQGTLSNYFNGKRKMDSENLIKICNALELNPFEDTQRFVLQNSKIPNHYIVTDTVNEYVIKFEKHKFNETQVVTLLNDDDNPDVLLIAKILRELTDWLVEFHPEKVL